MIRVLCMVLEFSRYDRLRSKDMLCSSIPVVSMMAKMLITARRAIDVAN